MEEQMEKLKRSGKTLSKKKATLDHFYGFHSIVRDNDNCIEVLTGMVGFASGLMTGSLTIFVIASYLFISAHPEGGGISDIIFTGLYVLVSAIGTLIFGLLPCIEIKHVSSPIRFNRKTRKIFIMEHEVLKKNIQRDLRIFDWDKTDFRRELIILPSGGGPPRIEHSTFFFGSDLNSEEGKEHKVQVATGTGSEEDQDIVWEYIRRFMENEEILTKVQDPEDDAKKIIRPVKQGESFNYMGHMSEYLPFVEQFKSKLRYNFIDPYTGTIIPRLKNGNPKLTMESTIGNIIQFIYYQLKFLVLLVYPFFAVVGIPGMLISSWAYARKPINEFPEENNELCGLGSMKTYIKELIKNGGKPTIVE